MSSPQLDAIRKIGFNNDVTVDGRTLHVQTEVVGSSPAVRVRTMVLESGVVRAAHTTQLDAVHSDLGAAERTIQEQHERFVHAAARGEVQ